VYLSIINDVIELEQSDMNVILCGLMGLCFHCCVRTTTGNSSIVRTVPGLPVVLEYGRARFQKRRAFEDMLAMLVIQVRTTPHTKTERKKKSKKKSQRKSLAANLFYGETSRQIGFSRYFTV